MWLTRQMDALHVLPQEFCKSVRQAAWTCSFLRWKMWLLETGIENFYFIDRLKNKITSVLGPYFVFAFILPVLGNPQASFPCGRWKQILYPKGFSNVTYVHEKGGNVVLYQSTCTCHPELHLCVCFRGKLHLLPNLVAFFLNSWIFNRKAMYRF